MSKQTTVRFRSRYPDYLVSCTETHQVANPFGPGRVPKQEHHGDLQFRDYIAESSDENVIRVARANPMFGKDFWEEDAAEIAKAAVLEGDAAEGKKKKSKGE